MNLTSNEVQKLTCKLGDYMQINPTNYDPDGFCSFSMIQSMSKSDIRSEYTSLSQNKIDPLQFLAKVCMAAQKLGFDKKEGRDLISISVELYAKQLGINPLKSSIGDKQAVIQDLTFRATVYAGMGEKFFVALQELYKNSTTAYDAWRIYEEFSL